METSKKTVRYAKGDKFKSYYVVWKPDTPGNIKVTDIVFKSYYVVWKRQRVKGQKKYGKV